MKKMMFFLSIIGVSLLMTSCLGAGSQNFSEPAIAYIARDNASGLVYARTSSGRFITSSQIQTMLPGSFKLFYYSWEESYGLATIENTTVYKDVIISGNSYDIPTTRVLTNPVSEVKFKPFVGISQEVYYADNQTYFDDHWILEYAYKAKEGENPIVSFYLREEESESRDEVVIDIRLSLSGTATGTSETNKSAMVAVDMAPVRAKYSAMETGSSRRMSVKFNYYVEDNDTELLLGSYPYTIGQN